MAYLKRVLRLGFTVGVSLYVLTLIGYLALRLLWGDRFWWLSLANSFAYLLFLPLLALLPAALLLRSRANFLRLLPFTVIAGLWFGPYYLPKSQPIPTGPTLSLLTFNVWGNNHDLKRVEQWLRETHADILLLQEISPTYAQTDLTDLLDLYPYQSSQADPTRWGGNIILSRYPILEAAYIDLHTPNTPSPLRLVLDVNGQRVAVYNVHLAWPSHSPRVQLPFDNFYLRVVFGFDDRLRNRQIAGLLQHLSSEPYPYIVGGDFNTSDQSVTYQQLAAQMHDSFREAGWGLGGSWPVSTARGLPALLPPLIRIDYLWHSDQFRTVAAWQGPRLGSDHLPLLATLELLPTEVALKSQ